MATSQPSIQDLRSSPAFSSNNPFRRAAPAPPVSPQPTGLRVDDSEHRLKNRKSTNPFLDDYQAPAVSSPPRPRSRSPQKQTLPQRDIMGAPTNLLDGLSLFEKPPPSRNGQSTRPAPSRDDMRPSAAAVDRRAQNGRGPPPSRNFDIFNRPDENRRPRPRRNSESSIMEVHDEERKRAEKEKRRRERAEREKAGEKPRDGRHRDGRPRRPDRRVDMIDKLDLTGIYGVGGAFHHDGPFDACNPHRNKKGRKNTPMSAFPEGSANMMMGGGGPVNKNMDFDRFHGRGTDAYNDWNATSQAAENAMTRRPVPVAGPPVESFDARSKIEQVHGEETAGLGTSTFLEGAAASRAAAIRRESESENFGPAYGLQRKKSLAQKIRGISKARANGFADRTAGSPGPVSPTSPIMTQSAGGRSKMNEANPFFSDIGQNLAQNGASSKETTIKINETVVDKSGTRPRAGSENAQAFSRPRGLSSSGWRAGRSSDESSDGYGTRPIQKQNTGGASGGFLNRVRSIKGKKRPDRPAAA